MKHAYRFTLLLSLPLLAFTQDGWVTQTIDTQLQVLLPSAAQEVDLAKLQPGLKDTRVWIASDAHALYQVIRVQMPPVALADVEGTENRGKYYGGVISGILSAQSDGVLLEQNSFSTAGGEGVEFRFRARHQSTKKLVVKYSRALLIGTTGYSFNFIPRNLTDTAGVSGQEQRRRFFSSITVLVVPSK